MLVCCTLLLLVAVCQADLNPWLKWNGSDTTYQFNDDENIWLAARENCLAQGGDLVQIETEDELEWLMGHYPISNFRERYIIIGLEKKPDGVWRWLNGADVDSSILRWQLNEPTDHAAGNERCAVWSVDARDLDDVHCDLGVKLATTTRYICERSDEQRLHVVNESQMGSPAEWLLFLKNVGKLNELDVDS